MEVYTRFDSCPGVGQCWEAVGTDPGNSLETEKNREAVGIDFDTLHVHYKIGVVEEAEEVGIYMCLVEDYKHQAVDQAVDHRTVQKVLVGYKHTLLASDTLPRRHKVAVEPGYKIVAAAAAA